MRFYTLISFLSAVVIFSSCKKPQGFDYKDIKDFKVTRWGLDKTKVSMNLVFFNPNNFGVDLRKVDCDIYLNNNHVGKFLLDTSMNIPRKADFTLPANFEVDMKNVFKNSFNVLFSNEVLIGAKGNTRVGKGGLFITVPFNYEGRHKVDMF